MKNKKKHKLLALTLLFSLGLFSGCGKISSTDTEVKENTEAQKEASNDELSFGVLNTFTCQTLDGGSFTEEILREKDLTILNFWATTCPPCIFEMPELESFRRTLPDNVQLILISLDDTSAIENVRKVIEKKGYTGTVAMCGDKDMEALNRKILYTPTTLFFDSDGADLGSAIIGSPTDVHADYTRTVNELLEAMGEEAVWNE